MQFQLINESDVEFTFNGRKLIAIVAVAVAEDGEPVNGSFDFGDDEQDRVYLERFRSGELINCTVRVTATYGDFQGTDYLGACHLRSAHAALDAINVATDHGMATVAITDLIAQMQSTLNQLTGA